MLIWSMRWLRLFLLSLAFACQGLSQDIQPPQIFPYTGPTIAYPETTISFSLLAKDRQPDSLGDSFDYELLTTPTNTSFTTLFGRTDEKFLFLIWQTPPRSALGSTNEFVIKVTDHGDPPLSATNRISFVVTDLPPINAIVKSNGVILLQIADLLPGKPYLVQHTETLPPNNWSTLTVLTPASPVSTITDTNPPAAQRYYRLFSPGWCHGFGCP